MTRAVTPIVLELCNEGNKFSPGIPHTDLRSVRQRLRQEGLVSVRWNVPIGEQTLRIINEELASRPGVTVWIEIRDDSQALEQLRFLNRVHGFACQCRRLKSFEGLRYLNPKLRRLILDPTVSTMPDLSVLDHFSGLTDLEIDGHTRGIDALPRQKLLQSLRLRSVTLPDLRVVKNLSQLKRLWIGLGGTKNLAGIESLMSLEHLELWLIKGLSDLRPVAHIKSLKELWLQSLTQVRALPDLRRLTKLSKVTLDTMKGLRDLRGLLTAPKLKELHLDPARQLQPKDLACLADHSNHPRVFYWLGSVKKNAEAAKYIKNSREPFVLP